jgi:hypothetical protein
MQVTTEKAACIHEVLNYLKKKNQRPLLSNYDLHCCMQSDCVVQQNCGFDAPQQ